MINSTVVIFYMVKRKRSKRRRMRDEFGLKSGLKAAVGLTLFLPVAGALKKQL